MSYAVEAEIIKGIHIPLGRTLKNVLNIPDLFRKIKQNIKKYTTESLILSVVQRILWNYTIMV